MRQVELTPKQRIEQVPTAFQGSIFGDLNLMQHPLRPCCPNLRTVNSNIEFLHAGEHPRMIPNYLKRSSATMLKMSANQVAFDLGRTFNPHGNRGSCTDMVMPIWRPSSPTAFHLLMWAGWPYSKCTFRSTMWRPCLNIHIRFDMTRYDTIFEIGSYHIISHDKLLTILNELIWFDEVLLDNLSSQSISHYFIWC